MKKKLAVLAESEQLITYLVQSTELKFTYGMDKLTAYYKAKAMLGEVQIMKLMIEQEIKQKMILLNSYMARDQNMQFDIDTNYVIENYESVLTDSTSISRQRSDFNLLNSEIDLLQTKKRYEISKKYPDYGIRYDHMFPFGSSPQQFSLMFMCTVPLAPWSKKMYTSAVKGLEFEMLSLKEEQRSLVNRVSGNLNNLKVMISTKKSQIELTEKLVIPSMKNNYEAELLAYEQNNEMFFMVLDAWQNLKLANLTRLDQIMELLMLQVQYEKESEVRK
jgi:outer membrane protein TolC